MAKKEVKTDLWVARQLDDSQIKYDAQGSNVKEISTILSAHNVPAKRHVLPGLYKNQGYIF